MSSRRLGLGLLGLATPATQVRKLSWKVEGTGHAADGRVVVVLDVEPVEERVRQYSGYGCEVGVGPHRLVLERTLRCSAEVHVAAGRGSERSHRVSEVDPVRDVGPAAHLPTRDALLPLQVEVQPVEHGRAERTRRLFC